MKRIAIGVLLALCLAWTTVQSWTTINSNSGASLTDSNMYKRILRAYVMHFPTSQYTCTGPGSSGQAQCENAVSARFWDGERVSFNNQTIRTFYIHQNENLGDIKVAYCSWTTSNTQLAYCTPTNADGTVPTMAWRYRMEFPQHLVVLERP